MTEERKRDSDRARELELERAELLEQATQRTREATARVDAKLTQYLKDAEEQGHASEEDTAVHRLKELMAHAPTEPAGIPTVGDRESPTPVTIPGGVRDADVPRDEHVLVVEDEPGIAAMLAERLKEEGYKVRTAEDGIDALIKSLRDQPPPDCILLDMSLPYLSGEGVIAALATTHLAEVPRIYISARPADSIPPKYRRDFIPKTSKLCDDAMTAIRDRIAEWRRLRPPWRPRRNP